jgi:hypothetical protein
MLPAVSPALPVGRLGIGQPSGREDNVGLVDELVAEPSDGDEVLRLMRILLHLLPEPFHVHVERLRITVIACTPNLFDEEVTSEQSPWTP